MAFNPFEHFDKLVFSNVFAGEFFEIERPLTMPVPGGAHVLTATPGQPDTITYWLNVDGHSHQITEDQAFAQKVWLHALYGAPLSEFTDTPLNDYLQLDTDYMVTRDELREAVLGMPHIVDTIVQAGMSEDQVWAFVVGVAPWAVA